MASGIKEESRPGKHRARFNSMTSIWYGLIIGALQAYLIVQSVRRFVNYAEHSWPYQRTPYIELNTYIALTGVAVLLLPFFLASCILQVGNSSNDNRMLGKHLSSRDEWSVHLAPNMLYQGTRSLLRTLWTHSGPTSSLVHVISSFCLLLPQTLMEAVLIKYGFRNQEDVWRTDLDALLFHGERDQVLSILRRSSAAEGSSTSSLSSASSSSSILVVDGGGVGSSSSSSSSSVMSMMGASGGVEIMRPEFVNYAVALIIFSVRYANVFWHSNKTFTVLFSIQMMVNSIHSLVSFCAFSVLYKLHVFGPINIFHKEFPLLLNNHVTLLLYIISAIILLLSSSVLYHYGYLKIAAFVKHKARTQYVTNTEDLKQYGIGWAYFPHFSALAVLLALAATQSPLVHDATQVYRASLDNCMLASIISSAAHMLLWIVLWLNLTTRSNWTFHVDVNIGRIRVKGLEALRMSADIALSLPTSPNTPATPMSSAMLVVSDTQAFAVTDVNSKKNILGMLLRTAQMKRDGESDERIYWPRRSPVAGTQNSLEDDEQPWLHETEKNTTASPCRNNKVTFHDDLPSPRKYASVPLPRMGGLKRGCNRDRSYNQLPHNHHLHQADRDIDEGDYAMLRGGKNVLTKHQLASDGDYEEHQELLALVTPSEQNTQVIPVQHCNTNSLNPPGIRETTNFAQGTPRSVQSTDSGYNGRSGSVSSASPPDRTASDSSSGVHSTYSRNNNNNNSSSNTAGNQTPQNPQTTDSTTNCHCEGQICYVEHSIYGQIGGLSRRSSMKLKSPTHPIYEASPTHGKTQCSIYESRIVPVVVPPPSVPENPYGDNLKSSKLVNLTNSGAPLSSSSAAVVVARENENSSPYNVNVNQWRSCSLNNRGQCPTPDYITHHHINNSDTPSSKKPNEQEQQQQQQQQQQKNVSGIDRSDSCAMEKVEKSGEEGVMIRRKPSLTRPKTQDMSPAIQSTPYGRCTNMKSFTSFTDSNGHLPPIPPPLPPLSFVSSMNSHHHQQQQHGTIPAVSSAGGPIHSRGGSLTSSGSFRGSPRVINHSPANYQHISAQYPRHSTIPNHSSSNPTSNGGIGGDGLSTFHNNTSNNVTPNSVNTYPMIQPSPSHYNHSPAAMVHQQQQRH